MNMTLKTRIALVTGASRGIGQEIALQLARSGAVVIGTATSDQGALSITNFLSSSYLQGEGVVCDVNDSKAVNALMEKIVRKYQVIDVLVNNAGITRDALSIRMHTQDWSDVLQTNLSSVFSLSQKVLKVMLKARYGRIVNVSSLVAHTGNVGQANYAASKAGLEAMSRVLAAEVAGRNITVNCVAPGFIKTDMTEKLAGEYRDVLCAQIPAKRMGTSEDVANAVSFLVSDAAAYITGSVLHVNGGLYMG